MGLGTTTYALSLNTLAIYSPKLSVHGENDIQEKVLYYNNQNGADEHTPLKFVGLCESLVGLTIEFDRKKDPQKTAYTSISTTKKRFLIYEVEPDIWYAACFNVPSTHTRQGWRKTGIEYKTENVYDALLVSRLLSIYNLFKVA
jgi:hypothetical protein